MRALTCPKSSSFLDRCGRGWTRTGYCLRRSTPIPRLTCTNARSEIPHGMQRSGVRVPSAPLACQCRCRRHVAQLVASVMPGRWKAGRPGFAPPHHRRSDRPASHPRSAPVDGRPPKRVMDSPSFAMRRLTCEREGEAPGAGQGPVSAGLPKGAAPASTACDAARCGGCGGGARVEHDRRWDRRGRRSTTARSSRRATPYRVSIRSTRRIGPQRATRRTRSRSAAPCTSPPTMAATATSCGSPTAPRRGPCWSRTSRPGAASSYPSGLTDVGGTLFFTADDGSHGTELWKSDGTAAGTVLVKDIRPGAGGSYPERPDQRRRHAVLHRRRRQPRQRAVEVRRHRRPARCWSRTSAPAADSGYPVRPDRRRRHAVLHRRRRRQRPRAVEVRRHRGGHRAGQGHQPGRRRAATPYDLTDRRTARCSSPPTTAATGRELWKSDGTAAGTVLVKDIDPAAATASSAAT